MSTGPSTSSRIALSVRACLARSATASVALVSAVLLIAACGQGAEPNTSKARPPAGGTVVQRLLGDWQVIDPQTSTENQGNQLTMPVYDRLVAFGQDQKLIPYLAKSWKNTASSAVFTLRTDATCADGAKVTPTVVANSFKRLFDPSTRSTILGRSFGNGPYSVSPDDGAGTVSFNFGTPYSGLMYGFASFGAGIICPSGLANASQLATKPSGSGPFTLESATHGDKVIFKARPGWKWGPNNTSTASPGFPSELVFQVVVNNTTAANLLTAGGLNVALMIGPDIKRLQADKSLGLHTTHSYGTFTMVFSESPGHITTDEAVREAIMTAVDPAAWNEAANSGYGGVVSSSFLTADALCYDSQTAKLVPKPDTAKSTSILVSDGYSMQNGKLVKDGKPLTVTLLGSPDLAASGPEYIFEQMTKVGITTIFHNVDRPTFVRESQIGNFDVVLSGNVSPVPDPGYMSVYYSGAFPPQGFNYGHLADPSLDGEMKLALQTTGSERCQHWANVQHLLLKKHYILPLAAPRYFWFGNSVDFIPFGQLLEPYSLSRTS